MDGGNANIARAISLSSNSFIFLMNSKKPRNL
jgi:hypothetical protein